jgi:hypothetical protein
MTDRLVDPTAERIARAGTRFEAREISQAKHQRANRIIAWWDAMSRSKGGQPPILDAEQAMAARMLDMYWHVVHDDRGITSSYGDQRWNGTPVGQYDAMKLNGPEWKETCRSRLAKAQADINDSRIWHAVLWVIEVDGIAEDVGNKLGYTAPNSARAAGAIVLQSTMTRLAKLWGYC